MSSSWDLDEPARRQQLLRYTRRGARQRLAELGVEPPEAAPEVSPPAEAVPVPPTPEPVMTFRGPPIGTPAGRVRMFVEEICERNGVTRREVVGAGPRGSARVVRARHEMCWRFYNEFKRWDGRRPSMPEIGRWLGGLDHSSVLHGIRRHQARLDAGEVEL